MPRMTLEELAQLGQQGQAETAERTAAPERVRAATAVAEPPAARPARPVPRARRAPDGTIQPAQAPAAEANGVVQDEPEAEVEAVAAPEPQAIPDPMTQPTDEPLFSYASRGGRRFLVPGHFRQGDPERADAVWRAVGREIQRQARADAEVRVLFAQDAEVYRETFAPNDAVQNHRHVASATNPRCKLCQFMGRITSTGTDETSSQPEAAPQAAPAPVARPTRAQRTAAARVQGNASRAAAPVREAAPCLDGCGEMPGKPTSRFRPGHDARLASLIRRYDTWKQENPNARDNTWQHFQDLEAARRAGGVDHYREVMAQTH